MTDFDKKIQEQSKEMKIPEKYNRRVEEVLQTIQQMENVPRGRKRRPYKKIMFLLVCVVCLSCFMQIGGRETAAELLSEFKLSIMNIFNVGEDKQEELGVKSEEINIQSKPDLLIELRETIIDKQNIYLLIQITAPKDVEFSEDITFDYFAFCEGNNFVTDNIISGPTDCKLAEVMEGKTNMATYVVSLMADQELVEESNVTVYLNNLTRKPYSDNPELLVEGMWSITFPVNYTVTEDIILEGNQEMEFSYVNTTAFVEKLQITPLGMVLISNVSNLSGEEMAVSDTRLEVRMKMIDGTEHIVGSRDPEAPLIVNSSGSSFEEEGESMYQRDDFEFSDMINLSKVAGIYVEDLYIPVK